VKKLVQKVVVKNSLGLHARPAAAIARLLKDSHSAVSINYRKEKVDARSIMGLLILAVEKGEQLTLEVEGEDATETMYKLVNAFETQFGE
jgi:phosphocarrier protein HPr